jgi:UDP-N-acetylglucosamine 2-epimerase (non-hydrolysing)
VTAAAPSGTPTTMVVAAARPNFMKVQPVLAALEARGTPTILIHTGQHYDASMSDVFFEELGIREPDRHLDIGSGTHAEQTGRTMMAFEACLEADDPDVVLVAGDVNATLACSIVAAKAGKLVGHIEAGLRSRDWGMPEEVNRVVTDRVSDYLFAPSVDAVDNLEREGYRRDQIHLVGNVMVDTLLANLDRAMARPTLSEIGVASDEYGLVTLHRPANVDDPAVFAALLEALTALAADLPLVFPVHPRTRRHVDALRGLPGIIVTEPLGYLDFISLQAQAAVVLTDSGGVQEETTVLGVPCLTLRDNTERPITVDEGTNVLVGRDTAGILRAARDALSGKVPSRRPALWDGRAGERIADVILAGAPVGGRPTQVAAYQGVGPA